MPTSIYVRPLKLAGLGVKKEVEGTIALDG